MLTQALCCRYHIHSTGQHRQQAAGQSCAPRMQDQRQAPQHEQSGSRAEQAELPAQHTLCTVSTALPQPPSRLCLQLPIRTHQQQQLQTHLQLHQRYQMDLAAGHLAEQLQQQQGSCRAADPQRHVLDSSASAGGPALSSWSQAPARSSAVLEASCGAEDSSATGASYLVPLHICACTSTGLCTLLRCDGCVGALDISEHKLSFLHDMRFSLPAHTATRLPNPEMACVTTVAMEMDASPEKQQRAPRSIPQDDLRRVAARQQRFMTQMLAKEGVKLLRLSWSFLSILCKPVRSGTQA